MASLPCYIRGMTASTAYWWIRRRARDGAVLTLVALGWPLAALAQAPVSPGLAPYEPPSSLADRVGLCQCDRELKSLRRFCMPSTRACETACSSKVYSFMPLGYNALTVCPPKELYVVLPNADGRPGSGAIIVTGGPSGTAETTLDRSYAAAADVAGGEPAPIAVSSEETGTIFKQAIGARPTLPRRYTLRFPPGGTRPPPPTAADYQALIKDIKSRAAYEIEVTGFTDTVADEPTNQKLSIARANAVAAALVRDGISKSAIGVTGYGKHFLAVETGDNVAEERNRRVEAWVR